jgi:PleD family two-component response regulator
VAEKTRVLLLEPDHKVAADLTRHLWNAPLVVDATSTLAGALMRVREFSPEVVVAPVYGGIDGEDLCRQLKRMDPSRAVLLVYPSDKTRADDKAEEAGADGWLYTPYNAGALVSCVKFAVRLRDATRLVDRLRLQVDQAVLKPAKNTSESSRQEVEFFKRTLLLEVPRSRRYRYPLALLAVGVDRFPATLGRLPVHVRTRELGKLLEAVHKTIRDIDLAVQEGQERFLVALPQTDLDGARYVAQRIVELLPKSCDEARITVTVGLAAYDGAGGEVSFKGLFDHALGCLENGQKLGGARVEVVS